MERHVTFDLLHDLMDMAVEHGHRAEALQHIDRLQAVVGAPTPVGINCPQRDMGEHHDRRRIRLVLDVVGEPRELLRSQPAESSGFEIDHVHKPDEMHSMIVEGVQPEPLVPLP